MFDSKKFSGSDALLEAQKIAFAPIIFQCARLLRDWGIFQLLQDNKKGLSAKEIAQECNISLYATQVLCESGFSMSALKLEDDKYFITTIGYFLLNDEMTKANMNYNHDVNYEGLFYLDEALKTSTPAGLHHTFSKDEPTIYPLLTKLPKKAKDSWFGFDHFYSDAAFKKLVDIMSKKEIKTLLDVGGNTGKWSVALTKASPKTSVTILDHQEQIDEAMKYAAQNGVKSRVSGFPLDLLDHSIAFPAGVDGVWMSQFLDCFSPSDIIELLKRAKNALNENGKVYIVEPFWDRQSHEIGAYCLINTSPYFSALANGTSKMYRASEMIEFASKAGLHVEEEINGLGFGHTLMVCTIKVL
ncbi:MAG: class I SAM-dependent methyltransferase [Campylobacterota bacterium]|nr:class I SAM-dependent methyltransferase [Campylobacterota bacterium]